VSPILEASGLTRRFGGLLAIDSVSCRIEAGEIRGIIGPNGAGKTTLVNLVSGYLAPSAGSIRFDGAEAAGLRADRLAGRGLRRTFQNVRLFGEMTVLGNVLVGLHSRARCGLGATLFRSGGQRREERALHAAALEALETVGLAPQAGETAASLAYGHRKMLEIARAIAAGPKLLLLDEPAAGLNPSEAAGLVGLIRRINSGGVTILLIEHHMDVVMSLCERLTVLHAGRVLADGPAAQVRNDPSVIEAYLGRGGMEERIAAVAAAGSHA